MTSDHETGRAPIIDPARRKRCYTPIPEYIRKSRDLTLFTVLRHATGPDFSTLQWLVTREIRRRRDSITTRTERGMDDE